MKFKGVNGELQEELHQAKTERSTPRRQKKCRMAYTLLIIMMMTTIS
jgi:hypothetical protein